MSGALNLSSPASLRKWRGRAVGYALDGFSLIELAIVLMVISVLFGGLFRLSNQWMQQRTINDVRSQLEKSRQALLAYAMRYGHLPCPADRARSSLVEKRQGGRCSHYTGILPSADLGLNDRPLIEYSVSPNFADDHPRVADRWPCLQAMRFARFNMCDEGVQKIYRHPDLGKLRLLVNDIVAVLLHRGRHSSPRGAAEKENIDGDWAFVRADKGNLFDDELMWVSANALKFEMTQIGMMY